MDETGEESGSWKGWTSGATGLREERDFPQGHQQVYLVPKLGCYLSAFATSPGVTRVLSPEGVSGLCGPCFMPGYGPSFLWIRKKMKWGGPLMR